MVAVVMICVARAGLSRVCDPALDGCTSNPGPRTMAPASFTPICDPIALRSWWVVPSATLPVTSSALPPLVGE